MQNQCDKHVRTCYNDFVLSVETRNNPAGQISAASMDAAHQWHGGLSVIGILLPIQLRRAKLYG